MGIDTCDFRDTVPDKATKGEVVLICQAAALLGWHELHCRAPKNDHTTCPVAKHWRDPNNLEAKEELQDLLF